MASVSTSMPPQAAAATARTTGPSSAADARLLRRADRPAGDQPPGWPTIAAGRHQQDGAIELRVRRGRGALARRARRPIVAERHRPPSAASATPRSRSHSARATRATSRARDRPRDRVARAVVRRRSRSPARGRSWSSWREPYGAQGPARTAPDRTTPVPSDGAIRSAPDARLYSAVDIHSAYSLCIPADVEVPLVVGRVADSPAIAPVPHIVTELPGPEGPRPRRLRRDLDLAEPAARLPDRAGPRRGPDASRTSTATSSSTSPPGIAVNSTGHCASAGRRRDQGAGGRAHPLLRVRLLPADLPRGLPARWPSSPRSRAARAAYLGNSGAEVVEASIKLARYATHRPYVVAFLGAFHGRTYGAVSLTASKAKYHAGFGPLLPGVFHAPFGRVEDLRWFDEVLFDKLAPANEVAAIIVEPIQGEGGYIVPEDGFLAGPARHLRPSTASCSSPTRSSPAPGGPARCGRSSTGASSRTSC